MDTPTDGESPHPLGSTLDYVGKFQEFTLCSAVVVMLSTFATLAMSKVAHIRVSSVVAINHARQILFIPFCKQRLR